MWHKNNYKINLIQILEIYIEKLISFLSKKEYQTKSTHYYDHKTSK